MSEPKHVTMTDTARIERPDGSTITYPKGALALVDSELADAWTADGQAVEWPPTEKPIETPFTITYPTPKE